MKQKKIKDGRIDTTNRSKRQMKCQEIWVYQFRKPRKNPPAKPWKTPEDEGVVPCFLDEQQARDYANEQREKFPKYAHRLCRGLLFLSQEIHQQTIITRYSDNRFGF